jgi:hypothetical protein
MKGETMELKEWKEAVFKTMLANKIDRFVVQYYGSGDEGGVQDIESYGPDTLLDIDLHSLPKATINMKHVNNLHDEIIHFANEIIDTAGYSGYGNGDGGEGTIEIDAANQKITIQHNWMEVVGNPEREIEL